MCCFIGGKRTAQVANQIPQVLGKVLIAHLVEVRASLFIGHPHETKHFFSGQLDSVLRFLTRQYNTCSNPYEVPVGAALPLLES